MASITLHSPNGISELHNRHTRKLDYASEHIPGLRQQKLITTNFDEIKSIFNLNKLTSIRIPQPRRRTTLAMFFPQLPALHLKGETPVFVISPWKLH